MTPISSLRRSSTVATRAASRSLACTWAGSHASYAHVPRLAPDAWIPV